MTNLVYVGHERYVGHTQHLHTTRCEGTTRCIGGSAPLPSRPQPLGGAPSQQQQWSPGGLQLAVERGALPQSVFYHILQETRMFGLLIVQVPGLFTRVLLGTALSAVAPAMLLFIPWVLRTCIVTHLGLVLHQRGPVHL